MEAVKQIIAEILTYDELSDPGRDMLLLAPKNVLMYL